jgi:cardiolipin synthase (CMP-forming)
MTDPVQEGPPTSAPARGSPGLSSLPNLITLARLCAVPLAFWLVLDRAMGAAFGLFVAAGASDAVDGWLARRLNGVTRLGTMLDPVADKALLVTMYVTLAAVGALPTWLATLVVFRDLVIVGGIVVLGLLGQPVVIRPLFVSKVKTVLQIVLVALTLFLAGFGMVPRPPETAMLALDWAVAATTLGSGAAYVWRAAHGR